MSVKVFIIRVNNSHILTMTNPNSRDAAVLHKINHRLFVFIHAQEREILSLADRRAAEDRRLHQSQRCKCDSCIWHVLSLEFVKVVTGGTWASLEMGLRPGVWIACKTPQRAPTAVFLMAVEVEGWKWGAGGTTRRWWKRNIRAPVNVSVIYMRTVLSLLWQMTCVRC